MSHVCDYPTAVKLRQVNTLNLIVDLHDPDNGFDIGGKLQPPVTNQRQGRRKSARVRGSYAVGPRIDDDATYVVPVLLLGDSWPEVEQRFIDLYDALRANDIFYLETELSGVRKRWLSDAPVDIEPVAMDRKNNRQRYDLVFLVQPNPTVTIV